MRALKEDDKWGMFVARTTTDLVRMLEATTLRGYALSDDVGFTSGEWDYIAGATGLRYLEQGAMTQFLIDVVPTLTASMTEIIGGMELLPQAFLRRLKDSQVHRSVEVTEVNLTDADVQIKWRNRERTGQQHFAFAVITIPPAELKMVRLGGIDRSVRDKKQAALRKSNVDFLAKALVHCSERFWERLDPPIFGGTSFTDLSIQQSWYPSDNARRHRDYAGRNQYVARNPQASLHRGVFTGAYTWGANAEKFAQLSEAEQRTTVIREVAKLHNFPREDLEKATLEVVTKVWENGMTYYRADEHQKCHLDLQRPLSAPGARPRVFFAGEYLGVVHGWIVSAIMPALKAVKDVLTEVENEQSFASP